MAVLDAQGATLLANGINIGGLVDFDGFDGEAADIDVTTLASTAMEYRPGLQEFGNISINLMRDPADAGQEELRRAKAAQETIPFVLTLASGEVANFSGYCKSITAAGGINKVVDGKANIKITGEAIWS